MPGPVRKFMTAADKNLLVSLFEGKKEILSRKAKGNHRNKWKKAAWDAIAEEFNSTQGISTPRTPEQLSKAWENLLAKAKKECVTVRQAINRCNNNNYSTQSDNSTIKIEKVESSYMGECHDTPVNQYTAVKSEASESCHVVHPVYNNMVDYSEDQYLSEDATLNCERNVTGFKEEITDDNNGSENLCAGTRKFGTAAMAEMFPNNDDLMNMYREQHEAKMTKLYWETLYWRTKYEREFVSLDNGALHASDSTGHGSSDDREN